MSKLFVGALLALGLTAAVQSASASQYGIKGFRPLASPVTECNPTTAVTAADCAVPAKTSTSVAKRAKATAAAIGVSVGASRAERLGTSPSERRAPSSWVFFFCNRLQAPPVKTFMNDRRYTVFALIIVSAVIALLAVLHVTQGSNQIFGKAGRDAASTSAPQKK